MTISYFQTLTLDDGANLSGEALRQNFCENAVPVLLECPEINCVSVFAPEQANDPYTDDGPSPELVFQFDVAEVTDLDAVFSNTDVTQRLGAPEGGSYSADVFESIAFDIGGVAEPSLRTAPLSFNVRYYTPVEDDAVFVDFYLKHHPQILAELPGIRNVYCYVPIVGYAHAPVPVSNCILGNEVVFDTVDALNASMQTEVRHRLRDDYNSFPVRPGPNTHYAMQRQDFRS